MDLRLPAAFNLGPLGQDPAALLARVRSGENRSGTQETDRAQAIEAAASGFESLFVSMLVKQMRETLEPGSFFGQDNGDVLGGLFDFTMGQHLAQAGSLGISKLVKDQLKARTTS